MHIEDNLPANVTPPMARIRRHASLRRSADLADSWVLHQIAGSRRQQVVIAIQRLQSLGGPSMANATRSFLPISRRQAVTYCLCVVVFTRPLFPPTLL